MNTQDLAHLTTDELLEELSKPDYTEKVRQEAQLLKGKLDFAMKHESAPTQKLFERIKQLRDYVKPH